MTETITVDKLIRIADLLGYPIFRYTPNKPYNLNIWGIRSNDKDTTKFNDVCAVFYEYEANRWALSLYPITTDPGQHYLEDPLNDKGTAVLAEGHHRGIWKYGFHKGDQHHPALVQKKACYVYRDNDLNDTIDINKQLDRLDYGMFGINMHRARNYGITVEVGRYSAGCQVHADFDKYNSLIYIIEQAVRYYGNSFSYTLITEKDLENYG